jgi:hypothetical protein
VQRSWWWLIFFVMLSLLRVVANQPSSRIAAVEVLSLGDGGGDAVE